MDHSGLLGDEIIGKSGGSCVQIYSQEKHCLLNKWAVLTNSQKSFKESFGFLKYSVSFTRENENCPNLEKSSFESRE